MTGPILVTGGNGMVGRNLLDRARRTGIDMVAPNSRELDLLDAAATKKYLQKLRPEIIVHLAGRVGGIQMNMREPVRFLVDNWEIGKNLMLAARDVEVSGFLNLGSSCMYPKNYEEPLKEQDVLAGPLEPTNEGYALAKISVARLGEYLNRETPGFFCRTLIPCNIYGPHDKFDPLKSHLIPAVIHKLHQAKFAHCNTVDIWGDGTARREFLYVGDLVDMLMSAIFRIETLPMYMNVGLGFDYTIDEYYRHAATVVGYHGQFVHDTEKPVGMQRKLTDVSRASEWGWHAQTSLLDGLTYTYDYYLNSGVSHELSTR